MFTETITQSSAFIERPEPVQEVLSTMQEVECMSEQGVNDDEIDALKQFVSSKAYAQFVEHAEDSVRYIMLRQITQVKQQSTKESQLRLMSQKLSEKCGPALQNCKGLRAAANQL